MGPIACTDLAGLVKMRNRAWLDSSYSAYGCNFVMRRKIKKILSNGADDLPETSFISGLLESVLSVSTVVRSRFPITAIAIPAIMELRGAKSSTVIDFQTTAELPVSPL